MSYEDDGQFPHASPDAIQRAVAGQQNEGVTPDTKYSKDEVNYRPAGSSSTTCFDCAHFRRSKGSGNGTCELVNGSIRPDFVCDEFEAGGTGLVDLITG